MTGKQMFKLAVYFMLLGIFIYTTYRIGDAIRKEIMSILAEVSI